MMLPILFMSCYGVLGMGTTAVLWPMLQDEIEMAIGMEDEEMHNAMRISMMLAFVLLWPIVLWDVVRRPRF
ncbi:MAG: hypothetical protein GY822_28020 [Deltaproteobacteria bacterium]|nr:hypothetical protein [Deltaproteobacteria bacterium]